jgi:integrase
MATMVYGTQRNFAIIRDLLQHTQSGDSTARYVASLPDLGDLTDPEYDLEVWKHYLDDFRKTAHRFTLGNGEPLAIMGLSEARDSAFRLLQSVGHVSVGLDQREPAVVARRHYENFCDGIDRGEFADGWAPDPLAPGTLAEFAVFEIEDMGNRVATAAAKVFHIVSTLPPESQATFRSIADSVIKKAVLRERAEGYEVAQAAIVQRDVVERGAEVLVALGELDLATCLIFGWNGALRPSSVTGLRFPDIVAYEDRLVVEVNFASKRRGQAGHHSYIVTLKATGDALCPVAHFARIRHIASERSFLTTARSEEYYWRKIRALLTAQGIGEFSSVSGQSMRHSRAIELYAETEDVFQVQMQLGHLVPRTTMTYLTRLSARIRSAAAFDGALTVRQIATDFEARQGIMHFDRIASGFVVNH